MGKCMPTPNMHYGPDLSWDHVLSMWRKSRKWIEPVARPACETWDRLMREAIHTDNAPTPLPDDVAMWLLEQTVNK